MKHEIDLSIIKWKIYIKFKNIEKTKKWSGKRDSNPRHSAWEADALPLNYSRKLLIFLTHINVPYIKIENMSSKDTHNTISPEYAVLDDTKSGIILTLKL